MELDDLLGRLNQVGGSDLHMKHGAPPSARADGTIFSLGGEALTAGHLHDALAAITESAPARREEFERTGEVDTGYVTDSGQRFRVSCFRQRGQISMVFRRVPDTPRSLKELCIPEGVMKLADSKHGLILVSGATGSGKSTTLAGMVSQLNQSRSCHIVTIEDPIEMVYSDGQSFITQREIGVDTLSFSHALRRVLRQDPDVIVIGELRDRESAEAALSAGESGHLVLSTMHTSDAVETVNRFIEFFPGERQEAARQTFAAVLRGAVAQRLLPRIGGGLVPAVEVLVNTARAADLIREPMRTEELIDVIGGGEVHGMQGFDDHLTAMVLDGLIERHTAVAAASEPHDFVLKLDKARRLREERERRTAQGHEPGPEKKPEPEVPLLRRAPDFNGDPVTTHRGNGQGG
jgi:twitching motility protein PilT